MSYEKQVRDFRKILAKLLDESKGSMADPPNVIAQNKIVVLSSIIEKAIMMCDEALSAATLQPTDVETILDRHSKSSTQYGKNPALDEVDTMRHEIERMTRAVDILHAMRRRRELSHRLVGHDPRLMGPWARWIRILEQYKINQDITDKHREDLLADLDNWRKILAGTG
jgi:hypothetical protein